MGNSSNTPLHSLGSSIVPGMLLLIAALFFPTLTFGTARGCRA